MKSILYTLCIALLVVCANSCSMIFNGIKGNGTIVENEIAISDYKSIEFSGGANLVYEHKNDAAPYLKIEIDENLYPLLTVKSDNGTLSIENKENINPTKYNIYTNSQSALESLSASGSIKAHIRGKLETGSLNISVSGSGNIVGDNIIANSIKTQVSGSGDITLAGKTGKLESSISGSGKTVASDMIADDVVCSVSGSGDFTVHANNHLKVDVSGSGDVRYKGNPEIDKSVSGSGKVKRMD